MKCNFHTKENNNTVVVRILLKENFQTVIGQWGKKVFSLLPAARCFKPGTWLFCQNSLKSDLLPLKLALHFLQSSIVGIVNISRARNQSNTKTNTKGDGENHVHWTRELKWLEESTIEQERNEEAERKRWSQQCHAGRKALPWHFANLEGGGGGGSGSGWFRGCTSDVGSGWERARGLSMQDSSFSGHS